MAQDSPLAVVDASVALKWRFDDEQCVSQAFALRDDYFLRHKFTLIAPSLLIYEFTNGLIIAARRNRIDAKEAVQAINVLLGLEIELKEVNPRRVLDLALEYGVTSYDAAYLALAEAEQCDLWTGDRAFYTRVKDKTERVKWIGDYKTG